MSDSNALLIPEILQNVFQSLNSAALASSARVCRLWSDVALDILWDDLPTLFPLLGLYGLRFSHTQWYGNFHQDYWDFGSNGPHVPEERHRRMYLPRIRSLQHNYAGVAVIKMKTLKELSSVGLYLPNLKKMHFISGGNLDDDFLGAFPFILPTIKSLRLPTMSLVTGDNLPIFRVLLESICNTPGLSLEYLDVGGMIILDPVPIEAVGSLVRQQTSLQHLGVTLSNTELFSSVCSKGGEHPTITSLKVYHPSLPPLDDLDFIRHLFRFRSLKALELDTPSTDVGIQEQDVISMASAWPTLQQLSLGKFWNTPKSLVSIARAFPCLDTLSVFLRCTGATWPQPTDSVPRLQHLTVLHLGPDSGSGLASSSPPLDASDASTLARLVIAICPSESELILHSNTGGDDVRLLCTSPDVAEAGILEVFRERPLLAKRTHGPMSGVVVGW